MFHLPSRPGTRYSCGMRVSKNDCITLRTARSGSVELYTVVAAPPLDVRRHIGIDALRIAVEGARALGARDPRALECSSVLPAVPTRVALHPIVMLQKIAEPVLVHWNDPAGRHTVEQLRGALRCVCDFGPQIIEVVHAHLRMLFVVGVKFESANESGAICRPPANERGSCEGKMLV